MKPLTTAAIAAIALAFAANGALAAPTHTKTATHTARATHAVVHRARTRVARAPRAVNPAQLVQSFFAGGWPSFYANMVQLARTAPRAGGHYVPSTDMSIYEASPAIDVSSAASQAQAASDAENQAIQQMNDTNAMVASMAAAEQQNDAANAAALQTELNANN
jgi:hypothetical protein